MDTRKKSWDKKYEKDMHYHCPMNCMYMQPMMQLQHIQSMDDMDYLKGCHMEQSPAHHEQYHHYGHHHHHHNDEHMYHYMPMMEPMDMAPSMMCPMMCMTHIQPYMVPMMAMQPMCQPMQEPMMAMQPMYQPMQGPMMDMQPMYQPMQEPMMDMEDTQPPVITEDISEDLVDVKIKTVDMKEIED